MFDAGTSGTELGTEVFESAVTTMTPPPTTTTRDRELHARLVAIRRARVALEAEELRCLLEVEATELYRRRGYASIREYMERELHYGPHAANERLRVARELQRLPRLAAAFDRGELPFSIVREVTRVATPHTEGAWLETARGKTAREVERRVAARRPVPVDQHGARAYEADVVAAHVEVQ